MKKVAFSALLISSVFISSISLNAMSFVSQLPTRQSGLNLDNLMRGNVFQLLMTREFWSHYPAFPNPQLLLLPSALLVMGLLLAGVYYFYLADRRNNQPLAASTIFLLTGFLPYGIGWMALAKNAQPANAELWLAFMLVAVFYGAIACSLYSAIQLLRKPSTSFQAQG